MAAAMMSSVRMPVCGAFSRATPAKQQPRSVRMRVNHPAAPDAKVTPDEIIEYAKTLPGVSDPFPNIFDPANLLANATSVQEVRRWRESEVTHGRVAMLAALGFIVGEQIEDSSSPFFPHVTGPAINHFQQVESKGAVFWVPLTLAIALAESYRVGLGWAEPRSSKFNQLRDDYEMGNLGFDPLGLLPTDPKERKDMQTKELNNGRLAMIAIAAFVAQELVSKDEIFEHLFVNIEKDVVGGANT